MKVIVGIVVYVALLYFAICFMRGAKK